MTDITRTTSLTLLMTIAWVVESLPAQGLTEVDLNDGTNWTMVGADDATADFGFDYTALGIPQAPNGTDSRGLRLAANIDLGEAASLSVSPNGVELTGTYQVRTDFWINYHTDPDNIGTTEFIGGFVGFDPSVAEPFNGAGFLGDSDGDTSQDYRLYKDDLVQDIATGQYDILSQNNTDVDLTDQFPGEAPPEQQTDSAVFDPPNDDVQAPDGTLAFGWHTLEIDVDANSGLATFAIDGFTIGTIDNAIDEEVAMVGRIALTYADIFASVSPNPDLSFGLFDNLFVTSQSAGRLQAGDSDMDLDFDQLDLVQVQIAAKYLTGQMATWGEGDWNGAPGGEVGNPPLGDGRFDQLDIITALAANTYLTGPYAAIGTVGTFREGSTSLVAVPEPAAWSLISLAVVALISSRVSRYKPRASRAM